MRFSIIFAGLAAFTTTVIAAPQVGGGSTCFDDGDCFFAGGSCVKSSGSITGTCSGKSSSSSSAAFSIPTSFNAARAENEARHAELSARSGAVPEPTAGPKSDHLASKDVNDIAEIARRVAARTDLPSDVIEAARKLAARGAAGSDIPTPASKAVQTANVSNIPSN